MYSTEYWKCYQHKAIVSGRQLVISRVLNTSIPKAQKKADHNGCGRCTASVSSRASQNKTNQQKNPTKPNTKTHNRKPPPKPKLKENPYGFSQITILFINLLFRECYVLIYLYRLLMQHEEKQLQLSLHIAGNSSKCHDLKKKCTAAPRRITDLTFLSQPCNTKSITKPFWLIYDRLLWDR